MLALMKLAYQRSNTRDFIGMALGGIAVIFCLGVFWLWNMKYNFEPMVNYELPTGMFDIGDAVALSMVTSLFNTISFLIFIFILLCLADYAISFVILCYHYDNESWETVKFFKQIGDSIDSFLRHDVEQAKIHKAERISKIREDISRIKDDNEL